jgi:pyruvate formate lyase activating enzyme
LIVRSGTVGVAYTYSEPYIWFETIMAVGAGVKERGLVNVMVTNGFMERGPLDELLTVVDAMNIDIKSIRPSFYTKVCKGRIEPVLRTCEQVKKRCHLEITNLLVTGLNDGDSDLRDLAKYMASSLGRDTPLHLSRCFPRYRMDCLPTPTPRLRRAFEICREYLQFVYIGNSDVTQGRNTSCPSCGTLLIEREGYDIRPHQLLGKSLSASETALCPVCGADSGIRMQSAPSA